MRQSIYAGSFLTVAIYVIWEVVTLGVLPIADVVHSYKIDVDAAQALRTYLGSSLIGYSAHTVAFFSILTSCLAQAKSDQLFK